MTDNLKPREIKFRAWDKERRILHPVQDLQFGNNGKTHVFLALGEDICSEGFAPEKFDLMQYTGLKDKNGEEIYEGDIVSIEHIYYQGIAQYDSRLEEGFRKIGNYVLKYDNGRFVFSNGLNSLEICNFWTWSQEKQFYYATGDFVKKNDRYGYFSKEYFRFLGLLGNIYENPEILEATDNGK